MNLKELFGSTNNSVTNPETANTLDGKIESFGYAAELIKEKDRYFPFVDYTIPDNFAKYGSAYKYYTDTITYIFTTYPYDGSLKEKQEWRNNSSDLDLYFVDNIYPRYKGFVSLGSSSFNSFATTSFMTGGLQYTSSVSPQFIYLDGRPRTDPSASSIKDLEKSNVYDITKNRQSNLEIDNINGNTIEFFFKLDDSNSTKTVSLLDIWNGSTNPYNRLLIELSNGNFFTTCIFSGSAGSTGAYRQQLTVSNAGWNINDWNHYAFTIKSETGGISTKLFVNGVLSDEIKSGTQLTSSLLGTLPLTGTLGAYQTSPEGAGLLTIGLGSGSVYGSFDEFRYWKKIRTQEEVYRNIKFEIGGGANTDDYTSDLGVYLKFNEGVFSTSALLNNNDAVCLDYSGRINNGAIYNYSFDVRKTGSAIESYSEGEITEKGDLIINSLHPDVVSILEKYQNSGSVYDAGNVNSLINLFPTWILDEEQELGKTEFSNLIQIISSYFDQLLIQIKNLPNLKFTDYAVDGEKIHPEYIKILNSSGFKLSDLFKDISASEELLSRSDDVSFEEKIENIKNIIYKNIYNNLSFIFKSKGTEKSFRNLVRCFGIDDDILNINAYSNNYLYTFEQKKSEKSVQKKIINFNSEDNFAATIFITKSAADSEHRSYLTGTTDYLIPYTVEGEFVFPKKFSSDSVYFFNTNFETASLFGLHAAKNDEADYTWETGDYGNFQVSFIRTDINKPDGYFLLESNGFGSSFALTSSTFQNVYSDNKWNLAVRLKNSKYDLIDIATTSSNENYILEFYGVNSYIDQIENEFLLTASISKADAINAIQANKRLYYGSHRLNFTSSIYAKTDIRLNSARFWYSYINNNTIKQHSFDPVSYGVEAPNINSFFGNISASYFQLPIANTLALYWNFDNTSTPDANGKFVVYDFSSGSVSTQYGSALGSAINKKHDGAGNFFSSNDINVVNTDYIFASKNTLPESVFTNDMIQIKIDDTLQRKIDIRPSTFYFTFEKSMYRVISNEMMRLLSSTEELNNLVGLPVNKFRVSYKDLDYMRQLFFAKINNEPDINKFIEFYKWIDSSIFLALQQLIPATANFSNGLSNVIESHVFERNKVNINRGISLRINKKKDKIRIGPVLNSNTNYANNNPNGSLWLTEKQPRNNPPVNTPGAPLVDQSREAIRAGAFKTNNEPVPTFYDTKNQTTIELYKDKFNYSKPVVDFKISKSSYSENLKTNNIDNFKAISDSARNFNIFVSSQIQEYGDINSAINKQKIFLTASTDLINSDFSQMTPDMMPFEHYLDLETSSSYRTNLHGDYTNTYREPSLQGVFAEKHVGGTFHRHNTINESEQTRDELYKLSSTNTLTVDTIKPRITIYRNTRNKSPINIKNILTTETDVGNYSKNYEIVQTVGRSINNKALIDQEGALLDYTTIKINGAITSSATSSRGTYKTIFVNRFAAPGETKTSAKAYLDPLAEEYSVYNSVNFRNLDVRTPLNISSSQTYSISEANPSLHKVNKNPFYGFALSGTSDTVITSAINYDNAFVSHAIPRSDKQYAWITASLSSSVTASGYISNYKNLDFSDQYNFAPSVSRSLGEINFNGYGLFLKNFSLDTEQNNSQGGQFVARTITLNNASLEGDKLNSYLLNSNGPYRHPTWKQVRNSYHPIVMRMKKTNTYIDQKLFKPNEFPKTPVDNNLHPLNRSKIKKIYSDSTYNWEIAPYQYYKNDEIVINVKNKNFLTYGSYFNDLFKFGDSITNSPKFDIFPPPSIPLAKIFEEVTKYKGSFLKKPLIFKFINLRDASVASNFINPYTLIYYNISKDICPGEALNTRGRTSYDDFVEHYKNYTSLFEEYPDTNSYSVEYPYNLLRSFWHVNPLKRARHFSFPSRFLFTSSDFADSASRTISDLYNLGGTSYSNLLRFDIRKNENNVVSFINQTSASSTENSYSNSIWALDYITSSYYTASLDGATYGITSSLDSGSNPFIKGELSPYNDFESFYFHSTNVTSSNRILAPHPQLFFSNKSATNILNPSFKSEFDKSNENYHNPLPYDSYDEFFEDKKPVSKEFVQLPEFVISDMVPYVLKYANGDFGGEKTTDFINARLPTGGGGSHGSYLRYFPHSILFGDRSSFRGFTFDKFFSSAERDKLKIKIRVDCILKLLPYKGFYPSDKVVDLSRKFINSLETNYVEQNFNDTPKAQKYLTLLQPFFAPGILLNTIKSSIATDWPIYITNSLGYTGTNYNSAPYNLSGSSAFPIMYATGSNINGGGQNPDQYFYFLDKDFNYKLPFESLLDFRLPQNLLYTSASLYYTDPSNFVVTGTKAFPSVSGKSISFADKDYALAMHNFLAETPNFFLSKKDGRLNGLTSIESKAASTVSVRPNTIYYMVVYMERNINTLNIISSSFSSEQSLFGPPTRFWNEVNNASLTKQETTEKIYSKYAYMPYAPGYSYGKEKAIIFYNSGINSGSVPLEDVVKNSSVQFVNDDLEEQLELFARSIDTNFTLNGAGASAPAYKFRNTLSSSLNLFGVIDDVEITQGQDGLTQQVTSGLKKWVIQTKFETPFLTYATNSISQDNIGSGVTTNRVKTIWTDLNGSSSSGLTLGIESPTQYDNSTKYFGNAKTDSLARLCGFIEAEGTNRSVSIGKIADNNIISEAVVVIPWTNVENSSRNNFYLGTDFAETLQQQITSEGSEEGQRARNKFYYKIDRQVINTELDDYSGSPGAFRIGRGFNYDEFSKINKNTNSSIINTIKMMAKYNIPPSLDWVRYGDRGVEPFVMYILEVEDTLQASDLAAIWQGSAPMRSSEVINDLGQSAKDIKSFTVEHNFGNNQFFHGKKLDTILTQFYMFKVKKKAKNNYYKITAKTDDDNKFKIIVDSAREIVPDYSYNWPYDYFSLIEGTKVNISLEAGDKPDSTAIANPNEDFS